jgi:Fe-S-cluster-containing dehydrogenase component
MDQNDIDSANRQHPFRNAFAYERRSGDGTECAYLSVACMHCDDAPCVAACPTGCLYKDTESGLTLFDNSRCIGCRGCAMSCPFGAPSFNPDGKMVKCDGCIQRLRDGRVPACVRVCPGGALTCRPAEEYGAAQRGRSLRSLAEAILRGG